MRVRDSNAAWRNRRRFGAAAICFISVLLSIRSANPDDRFSAAHGSLAQRFLALDATFDAGGASEFALQALERLVDRARSCDDRDVTCVLETLFEAGELSALTRSSDPAESLVTSALVNRRGTCAALVGVAMIVGDEIGLPLKALILREHVLLASGDSTHYFELLENGKRVDASELFRYRPFPPGGPLRVASFDYLPYYLDNVAARLADAGATAMAEEAFREALVIAPRSARIRFNHGTFLLQRQDYRAAESELTRSFRLGWRDATTLVNRGVARWRLGRLKQARRDFRRALDLDPGNRDAAVNLRMLESRQP